MIAMHMHEKCMFCFDLELEGRGADVGEGVWYGQIDHPYRPNNRSSHQINYCVYTWITNRSLDPAYARLANHDPDDDPINDRKDSQRHE